ncbi:MAG: hypothetical protein UHU21_00325, partial [Lachnospiraceae bacterium]|nr:hypothetical protein [Lachnospiraceae bacterium]
LKTAAQTAWNWVKGLFGGKKDKIDTEGIDELQEKVEGTSETISATVKNTKLKISEVDASAISKANDFTIRTMKALANTVNTAKLKLPTVVDKAISTALSNVRTATKKMKDAMNFTWRLPTLHGSIPRFDVSMSSYGDGNTHVSVPNINVRWSYFANGGILKKASVIGAIAGEAGPEAVLPLDKLWSEMDKRYGKGGRTINNTFNITGADNPELTAQIIARRLKMQMRMA